MNQKFHERLPDDFRRAAIGHEHVHKTVKREQHRHFCDDKQLLRGFFSPEAWHTLGDIILRLSC